MSVATSPSVPCPMCGEHVSASATVCEHCGEAIGAAAGQSVPGTRGRTREQLRDVATWQKAILVGVLLNILAYVAVALGLPQIVGGFVFLSVAIFQLVAIFRLGRALGLWVWIWVVGALLPCVSLLVLLVMNGKATAALQQAGIRVGLLGARLSDI